LIVVCIIFLFSSRQFKLYWATTVPAELRVRVGVSV